MSAFMSIVSMVLFCAAGSTLTSGKYSVSIIMAFWGGAAWAISDYLKVKP